MADTEKAVLVTGGAGFIGSHLCKQLHDAGHTVISLDNYSTGSRKNHIDGVEYREGHTKDIEQHISEKVDYIFHLGEYARVEQSLEDVATVLDFNTVGTQAVLEYARKHNAKLVYAGSSTKFADGGMGRNQSPYAWTKAANTELVRQYGEWFGLSYAITYFYNVYGPGERGDQHSGTVIAIFREQYKSGKPLTVRQPGTQRRNFTHVNDIVDGLMRIGEHGHGDEYGLGAEESYSIQEIAEMFGGDIEWLPDRQGNRMSGVLDTDRARLELGWHAQHKLIDYINDIKRNTT